MEKVPHPADGHVWPHTAERGQDPAASGIRRAILNLRQRSGTSGPQFWRIMKVKNASSGRQTLQNEIPMSHRSSVGLQLLT
jgi:hypothetical protein